MKLNTRLEKLENQFGVDDGPKLYHWVGDVFRLPKDVELQPGERKVLDIYRRVGHFFHARERITSDPNDYGLECGIDGVLPDVAAEVERQKAYPNPHMCHAWFDIG